MLIFDAHVKPRTQSQKRLMVERLIKFSMYLWVATGLREPDDIRGPLKLFQNRGVKVLVQEIVAVDPVNRTVKTDKMSLSYDYLVVSLDVDLRPDLLPGNQYIHHAWDLKGASG